MRNQLCLLSLLLGGPAFAQTAPSAQDIGAILERLTRLEQQNRELTDQVRELRQQLGVQQTPAVETVESPPPSAPIAERLELAERRVAEVEQTHVATENRLPVTLTGMVLFNSFLNGKASGPTQYPTIVPATGRGASGGATMRQTVIGLRADGPTVWGAKVRGSLMMDFYPGSGLAQYFRIRTASLDMSWKRNSVMFGFEKPLIAMRDPDSLAQVGVSPLTGAGNLWLWQPQLRLEHRVDVGRTAGLKAQFSMYQTSENYAGVAAEYTSVLAPSRPGYQGRVEFTAGSGSRRLEIATGFHGSSTHVEGLSLPSRIVTADWLIRPFSRIQLTGTYFQGKNVGVIGGLRQGVVVTEVAHHYFGHSVPSRGGWAQLKLTANRRTTINLFAGQQDDRNRDLAPGAVLKNQTHGGNVMFRWGPNLITSFEATQTRTTYGSGTRLNPHYDLAFAYLF